MQIDRQHIVQDSQEARVALKAIGILDEQATKALFVINDQMQLVGSLTDGDIRRGLLNGLEISEPIGNFMNTNFKFLRHNESDHIQIKKIRAEGICLIPVIDDENYLLEILDLNKFKTKLPFTALLMAGGRGERLRPLTETTPKPMLKIGNKPIIEHNIDRLISYGIDNIYISVKYLKEQIIEHFGDGSEKGISIKYIEESEPLGTIGALSYIDEFNFEDVLVMNSDLLTNIDFEDFYNFYVENEADMALASVPYHVNIPYAVLQTEGNTILSFCEKPNYTYYSNGGIYLMKKALKNRFIKGNFFNATDLMDIIITDESSHLVHYPLLGYWLDIGKHQDFMKAQEDIKHLNF